MSPEALLNAMRRWPATDMGFFLARGSRGKLVGCALGCGRKAEDIRRPLHTPQPTENWTKTSGLEPSANSPITTLIQLTHLEVAEDNPGAVGSRRRHPARARSAQHSGSPFAQQAEWSSRR